MRNRVGAWCGAVLVAASTVAVVPGVAGAEESAGQDPQRVRVADRRVDAGGVRPTPARLELADVTEVYYAVPRDGRGRVTISTRFRMLVQRDSRRRDQGFATSIWNGDTTYYVVVVNNDRTPSLRDGATGEVVEDAAVEVERRLGPGGHMTVRISDDVFTSDRFRVETNGFSRSRADSDRSAFDVTRPARLERTG